MKHILTYLFVVLSICGQAQNIDPIDVYNDENFSGNTAEQSFFNASSERYTFVSFGNELVIDSAGTKIEITPPLCANSPCPNETSVLIKYDSLNKYLFHNKFLFFSNNTNGSIPNWPGNTYLFQAQADAIGDLTFVISGNLDSLVISDPTKSTPIKLNNLANNTMCLIGKFSKNGELLWVNKLERLNAKQLPTNQFNYLLKAITITNQNNINVNLDVFDFGQAEKDTLVLISQTAITDTLYLYKNDYIITLNTNGNLLKYNKSLPFSSNTTFIQSTPLQAVHHQNNTFTLFRFKLSQKDTLLTTPNLILDTGAYLILTKYDNNNNLITASVIGDGEIVCFDMCLNVNNNEVILGLSYVINEFNFSQVAPSPFMGSLQTIMLGYNQNCNLTWHKRIESNFFVDLYTIEYSPHTKQTIFIGIQRSTTLKLDSIVLTRPTTNHIPFVAIYDSLMVCVAAKHLLSIPYNPNHIRINSRSRWQFLNNGELYYIAQSGIGHPFINKYGEAHITGNFLTNIDLGCKNLIEQLPLFNYYRGFVVKVFYAPNTIDTVSCVPIKSPGGKFIYDTSGMYTDTITTQHCDSIIKLRVTILQSKSSIDTVTCNTSFISPSGKYVLTRDTTITDTIPNQFLCDSLITLKVKFLSSTSYFNISSCYPIPTPSGNVMMETTGMYYDTIPNSANCDSLITINFTLLKTTTKVKLSGCDSLQAPSKKFWLNASGNYTDTLTNQFNCDSILDISFTKSTLKTTILGANNVSCDTPFVTLFVNDGIQFKWEPESFFTAPNSSITQTKNIRNNTWIKVIVSDSLKCTSIDSIEIKANFEDGTFEIPNVITVNDDGVNDCLSLPDVGNFSSVSFTVYNRWGQPIFETNDVKACWGENPQEKNISQGTYFYVLSGKSSCGTTISRTGTITVIK